MTILLTIIHVIVCLFLIIVVLLQSGKAADLAGAFGGMGSQTAFGPRGAATILSKATTVAAILFMVGSLSLAILHTREGASAGSTVLENAPPPKAAAPAPDAPKTIEMELKDESTGQTKKVEIPVPPKPEPAPKK